MKPTDRLRRALWPEERFHNFPFYNKMDDASKAFLRDVVIKKKLEQGQIMMGDNTRCTSIPMVVSGQLRLFRISDKGREMTLYRVGAGELCIMATVCAIGDVPYDFSIEAEKDSLLLTIPPTICV